MAEERLQSPDTLLLITPDCSRCPLVLDALARLIKEGAIGRLEVVNLLIHPGTARQLDARSVPWTRIGPFVLEGLHSYHELKGWAEAATGNPDYGRYLSDLIETGRLGQALALVRRDPERLEDLINLLASPETPMGVRIGVGALLEDLEGSHILRRAVPRLLALCAAPEPETRADACHYLSLAGDPSALPTVRALLRDEAPQVREIARETLDALQSESGPA